MSNFTITQASLHSFARQRPLQDTSDNTFIAWFVFWESVEIITQWISVPLHIQSFVFQYLLQLDNSTLSKHENKNTMGVCVSTHVKPNDEIADDQKTVFDWCQEGNTNQVMKILNSGNVDIDEKDAEVCILSKLAQWNSRVAMVREKYLENEIFSMSGKSQGILWMGREILKGLGKSGKSQGIWK